MHMMAVEETCRATRSAAHTLGECLVLVVFIAGCQTPDNAPPVASPEDSPVTKLGSLEVTARLVEVPEGAIFKRDLYNYLYVPLGGNRRGPTRTYGNLLIVMLLGGLWHGANWTYVAWGLYHGVLLALERAAGKSPIYRFLPRPVRVAMTFVLVLFSWVLFRSVDMSAAVGYLSAMAGSATGGECGYLVAAELYTPTAFTVMATCWLLVFAPVQAHGWTRTIT